MRRLALRGHPSARPRSGSTCAGEHDAGERGRRGHGPRRAESFYAWVRHLVLGRRREGAGQARRTNQQTVLLVAVADGWIEREPVRPRVEPGTERHNVRRHLFFRVKKGPRGILFLHWTPLCCFSDTPMTRDLRRSVLKRMQLWVARHEKWFIFEQVFSE